MGFDLLVGDHAVRSVRACRRTEWALPQPLRQAQDRAAHLRSDGRIAKEAALEQPADAAIQLARVHLVMPHRELFGRYREEASASVVLKLHGPGSFSPQQVLAVQNLVASAVPGLKPQRVSVIDDKGNLLAHPAEDGAAGVTGQSAEDMRLSYENRLTRSIETLLERSVGPGKVRAEVTADMDFDRVSTKAEIYDPDGQVVRSTQTVEQSSDSNDKQAQEPVSVQTNLPNAPQPAAGNPATSASKSSRTEETVNYEITKTVKNQIRETGTVKRLSVAVLVDGTYTTAPDGTKTYAPRTEAEMQQLEKLVRSAIGYNADRGDVVDLVNMPFAPVDDGSMENVPEPLFGLTLNDYLRIAELLVLAIVAILVLLMVVRPLVARLIEAIPKPSTSPAMLSDRTGAAGQLPGPGPAPNIASAAAAQQREELEQMIDINQVEGRVKASSLKKIGEIIDKHPEETVSIIRTWMFQET